MQDDFYTWSKTSTRYDAGYGGMNGGKYDAAVTEPVLPKSATARATKDSTHKT